MCLEHRSEIIKKKKEELSKFKIGESEKLTYEVI